jgi:hypothetical protein
MNTTPYTHQLPRKLKTIHAKEGQVVRCAITSEGYAVMGENA